MASRLKGAARGERSSLSCSPAPSAKLLLLLPVQPVFIELFYDQRASLVCASEQQRSNEWAR